MTPANISALRQEVVRVFHWRRVKVMLVTCSVYYLLMLPGWLASYTLLAGRLAAKRPPHDRALLFEPR